MYWCIAQFFLLFKRSLIRWKFVQYQEFYEAYINFCFIFTCRSLRRNQKKKKGQKRTDVEMEDLSTQSTAVQTDPVFCDDIFEFSCEFYGMHTATQVNIPLQVSTSTSMSSNIYVSTRSKNTMTQMCASWNFSDLLHDEIKFKTVIGIPLSFFRLLVALLKV